MIRRPPRSTLSSSSAASDVYKRQHQGVATLLAATEDGCGRLGVDAREGYNMMRYTEDGHLDATQGEDADIPVAGSSCYVPTTDRKVKYTLSSGKRHRPLRLQPHTHKGAMHDGGSSGGGGGRHGVLMSRGIARHGDGMDEAKCKACGAQGTHGAGSGLDKTHSGTAHILSLIHISEPTRLLSISYAVFCLKKKKKYKQS
eukprot:TRINITY_DN45425_c0_g1_i1.p1 TRINITY_DN45425_c0_g1~~TRINITY_DN45425_c0_g1_i1.p1  ORF type:complete len:200 (+),score=38.39 TRINITY_DN45425_c0_g1_i1:124-723(+)